MRRIASGSHRLDRPPFRATLEKHKLMPDTRYCAMVTNYLRHILKTDRWRYLLRGAHRRIATKRECPCCHYEKAVQIDRKLVYTLERCQNCRILYRFPTESPDEMLDFYQHTYAQPGLTTDLPDDTQLERLIATKFAGSEKDFTRVILMLAALGVRPGAAVLDYGANWGYGTFQMQQAGYRVEAYEVSVPRTKYGEKLGVRAHTSMTDITKGLDVVYSSHVLEHVPNPLAVLRQQIEWLRPGGMVIAHTPNGSQESLEHDRRDFHMRWSRVHPVLVTDEFLLANFGDCQYYVSSDDSPESLTRWGMVGNFCGRLAGPELVFILRPP